MKLCLIALINCLFIFVEVKCQCTSSSCGPIPWVCCGNEECRLRSCFGSFCRQDTDCSNQRDRLICCGNRCMFGSNCAGRSCSLDSDCSVNQVCCHSKCVLENRCIGERCVLNSHCRANQACCNSV